MEQTQIEIRFISQDIEIRTESDTTTVTGYAALFQPALSEDLGQFRENIKSGAFTRSLKESPSVFAYYAHDNKQVLGRTDNGSLRLKPNQKGLQYELDLNTQTTLGRDIAALVARKDVAGVSFGFQLNPKNSEADSWNVVNDFPIRTLNDVDLFEISIVASPAYPQTSAALRSLDAWKTTQAEPIEPVQTPVEPAGRTIADLAVEALKKLKLIERS